MPATEKYDRRRETPSPPRKRRFDIEEVIRRLRDAVAPYPKAALFELAAEGHTSVFEILVACIISIRTRMDTVSTQPSLAGLGPGPRSY